MIKITDNYFINATSNCYILHERVKVQDEKSKNFGQDTYKELGYYTTIDSLLKGFVKVKTREFISKSEQKNLSDLIIEIHKLNDTIEKFNLKGV